MVTFPAAEQTTLVPAMATDVHYCARYARVACLACSAGRPRFAKTERTALNRVCESVAPLTAFVSKPLIAGVIVMLFPSRFGICATQLL